MADWAAEEGLETPVFRGKVGNSGVFFGFDLAPRVMVGAPEPQSGAGDPGYFVVFEQAPGNQKFGLDQAEGFSPADAPARADDLTWGHFAANQGVLDGLRHATSAPRWRNQDINGARWGRTSAETAKLALQSPVRVMFHASGLLDLGEVGR